jgi:hypothetical protein
VSPALEPPPRMCRPPKRSTTGAGTLWIDRRPILAGFCFGALCYKPHFALLVPVALLAGQHWRALAASLGSAAALCGLSLVVFGWQTWTPDAFARLKGALNAGASQTGDRSRRWSSRSDERDAGSGRCGRAQGTEQRHRVDLHAGSQQLLMAFIDLAVVKVEAGTGGSGACSFARFNASPRAGPTAATAGEAGTCMSRPT